MNKKIKTICQSGMKCYLTVAFILPPPFFFKISFLYLGERDRASISRGEREKQTPQPDVGLDHRTLVS